MVFLKRWVLLFRVLCGDFLLRGSPLNRTLKVLGINMGRRRELVSIASGIIGSFRSRNNDVDGYWGIGKLYLFVDHLQSKCVSIDLCSQQIEPYYPDFDLMTKRYSNMFAGLLTIHAIPFEWVNSAYIYVEFEADYEERHHHWRSALGNPCNLVCEVIDDKGKSHVARAYTNCFPHDAKRESQSSK